VIDQLHVAAVNNEFTNRFEVRSIITATPYWNRGKPLREIRGKHGAPFGETIMQNPAEGTIKETTYWWPRPGSDQPFEKKVFYTKISDQICAVGYYEE
jgi:hypothetical protein